MVKGANGKEEERERAQCNYCEADYAADSKNCGTSTLWSHIEHKCKQCPFSTYVQKHTKQGMITDYFTKTIQDSEVNSSKTRTSMFSQATVRKLIGKYFIIDELLFRNIEVDNASSNDVALRKVNGYLTEKDIALVLDGEMFHMRYCAHILNLVVNDGFKDMSYAISSIRNAVRYVRSSPTRLKQFREAWDVYYTKYFEEERVNEEKLDGPPEASDWSNAEVFVKFLNSFYQLTLKFSGSLYVTSNLFFQEILQVQVELNDMKASKDELISKMAGSMQLKFNKYWGNVEKVNLLEYIASILDPRFKLDVVRNGFKYLYDAITAEIMIKKVKNMMTSLYAFYQKIVVLPNSSNDQQATENATFKSNASSSSTSFLIKLRFVSSEVATNDLDDYLNDRKEKLLDNVDFDILDWWKRNSSKYPVVSRIANDVLAVQISSVASELAFSTGGRILYPFRSSLSPKTVEALICSKNRV
uniref:Transposase n=1 Tax=Cannabis sativa TaxID=3483 RepID=A0A803Q163_CANSA